MKADIKDAAKLLLGRLVAEQSCRSNTGGYWPLGFWPGDEPNAWLIHQEVRNCSSNRAALTAALWAGILLFMSGLAIWFLNKGNPWLFGGMTVGGAMLLTVAFGKRVSNDQFILECPKYLQDIRGVWDKYQPIIKDLAFRLQIRMSDLSPCWDLREEAAEWSRSEWLTPLPQSLVVALQEVIADQQFSYANMTRLMEVASMLHSDEQTRLDAEEGAPHYRAALVGAVKLAGFLLMENTSLPWDEGRIRKGISDAFKNAELLVIRSKGVGSKDRGSEFEESTPGFDAGKVDHSRW